MRGVAEKDWRADRLSVDAKVGCELIEEEPETREDAEGDVLTDDVNDTVEDTQLVDEELGEAVELGLIDEIKEEVTETVEDTDVTPEMVTVTMPLGEEFVVPVGVDIELGEIVE